MKWRKSSVRDIAEKVAALNDSFNRTFLFYVFSDNNDNNEMTI